MSSLHNARRWEKPRNDLRLIRLVLYYPGDKYKRQGEAWYKAVTKEFSPDTFKVAMVPRDTRVPLPDEIGFELCALLVSMSGEPIGITSSLAVTLAQLYLMTEDDLCLWAQSLKQQLLTVLIRQLLRTPPSP